MAQRPEVTARRLWQLIEPIHAVTYFSPEPLSALKSAGYRGFWMGYFAGRAAPLGKASAELVHAVFYNFSFSHVARALPDAWQFAPPSAALSARQEGSVAALRRILAEWANKPVVGRAADLAMQAARHAPLEGRALFAANRSLPEPVEPLARLWHAATLLREHRGDGHVAALVAAGIGGRQSHVFHAVATDTPESVYELSRGIDPTEWEDLVGALAARSLVDGTGRLSAAGRELKQSIEDTTDRLASTAFAGMSSDETTELADALRPITARIIAAGEIPAQSPMGLNLADV